MVHTVYKIDKGNLKIVIQGRLDTEAVSKIWSEVVVKLSNTKPSFLEVDATGVEYCDGGGAAMLLQLKQRQEERKSTILN